VVNEGDKRAISPDYLRIVIRTLSPLAMHHSYRWKTFSLGDVDACGSQLLVLALSQTTLAQDGERGVGRYYGGLLLDPTLPVHPAIYSYEGGGGEAGKGMQQCGPSLPDHAVFPWRWGGAGGGGCHVIAESIDCPAAPSAQREGADSMVGGGSGPSQREGKRD
jgi:hypothetical protein